MRRGSAQTLSGRCKADLAPEASLQGLALLCGRGQVDLRNALRIGFGRALADRASLWYALAWGIGCAFLNSLFSRGNPGGVALASILFSFSIAYLSEIPWRIRLFSTRRRSVWRIVLANGLLACVAGYVVFFMCLFVSAVLFWRHYAFTAQFLKITAMVSSFGILFALTGIGIALGRDAEQRQGRLKAQARRLERLAAEAHVIALRSQMNPHFFFNSLNTIAALIPVRPRDAERAVELLAEALRPALTRGQPMTATVESEERIARAYSELEQLRFGDRVRFEFLTDPAAAQANIPSLALQPLVENAVRHGASRCAAPYRIRCSIVSGNGAVEVTLSSAPESLFEQLDADTLSPVVFAPGHALHNIATRLRSLYGPAAELAVHAGAEGEAVARMVVPRETRA